MRTVYCLMTMFLVSCATASDSVTVEPNPNSYSHVSQYALEIDAPANVVWVHLIDLPSWMNEFEMSLVSGTPKTEGEVRRLYEGQDFLIQITKAVPNDLLVISNLPSTFNGESSTGISVITLNEVDMRTTVRLVMSRRYSWDGSGENPQKAMRESPEFAERSRAMWEDRLLGRLQNLSESE